MALRRITALVMTMVPLGCGASIDTRVRALRPVPAHWVDRSDAPAPDWRDFTFDALHFATPTDGWIVGNRYFLHIADGRIAVAFVRPTHAWLGSVDFISPDDGWVGGFRLRDGDASGVIWHLRDGRWIPADLGGLGWPDWFVGEVRASPLGEVWATAGIELAPDHALPPAPKRIRHTLLRSDGVTWHEDQTPPEGDRRWAFYDMCFQPSGEGWFVGVDVSDPAALRALAVRRRNDGWERVPLPELANSGTSLDAVQCLGGDRLVALGSTRPSDDAHGSRVLLRRHDGAWQRIELPDAFRYADVQAIAAASDTDVWLALSRQDVSMRFRPTFLHWVDGVWTEVPPPALPTGRADGFLFSDMQFVSPAEGWAIGNADGFARGLIFHYQDGVWRLRNWGWHFWDAPGFGLWEH
jgi:hypothetical protein